MHSKLDLHKHVSCEDIILQLDQCHNEGILHRYLGNCNKFKNAMNDCLQAEVYIIFRSLVTPLSACDIASLVDFAICC